MKIVLGTLRRLISEVLLLEDRVSDAKKKYPELEKEIDELASSDPSGSQKYLMWSAKQLSLGVSVNDLIPTVEFFHKNGPKFKNRDINAYKTLKELEDELKSISPTKTQERKATKESGVEKMGEDDDYELVHVKNKGASQLYGSGTKWCITMKDHTYFEQYTSANVVFYFALSKTLPDTNPLYKVAFAAKRDVKNEVQGVDIFDATDKLLEKVPIKLRNLLKIVEQDAPKREMSLLAKIKLGKATEEEIEQALKLYDDDAAMLRLIVQNAGNTMKKIAPRYIQHHNADIRVLIARVIDQKYLPEMMNDENGGVRAAVAWRVDPSYLPRMMKSIYPDVRTAVARCIEPSYLIKMMNDVDGRVRLIVAERIDVQHLSQMMSDDSINVRDMVARRIEPKYLQQMMNNESFRDDKSSRVIETAKRRIRMGT
jgi:hypothetical protein